MSDRPFIVYALPRSRTAWMASLLSYRDWVCIHEAARTLREPEDIRRLLSRPRIGVVETAGAPAWRLVRHYVPGIREAVVFRPIDEVIESCRAIDISSLGLRYDFDLLRRNLSYIDRHLRDIASQAGVLSLSFADLETEAGCKTLFEHCLPFEFDGAWWQALAPDNIQVDVVEHLRYCQEHRGEIDGFMSGCKRELWRLARSGDIRKEAA